MQLSGQLDSKIFIFELAPTLLRGLHINSPYQGMKALEGAPYHEEQKFATERGCQTHRGTKTRSGGPLIQS